MGRPTPTKSKPTVASTRPETVSKAEAVRRALAEGIDSPGEIARFAKTKYGLDIPVPQASSYKSQIKSRQNKQRMPTAAKVTTKSDVIADIEAVKHLVEKLGAEPVRRLVKLFE